MKFSIHMPSAVTSLLRRVVRFFPLVILMIALWSLISTALMLRDTPLSETSITKREERPDFETFSKLKKTRELLTQEAQKKLPAFADPFLHID